MIPIGFSTRFCITYLFLIFTVIKSCFFYGKTIFVELIKAVAVAVELIKGISKNTLILFFLRFQGNKSRKTALRGSSKIQNKFQNPLNFPKLQYFIFGNTHLAFN
jgi:hypothetical protein